MATTEMNSEKMKAKVEAWPGKPIKPKHKLKSCGEAEVMGMAPCCDDGVVLNECCKAVPGSGSENVTAKGVDWMEVLKKILTEVDWETLLKFIRETVAVFQEGEKGTEPSASNHDLFDDRVRVSGLGVFELIKLYRTVTKYISPEDLAKLVEVVKGLLGALQATKSFANRTEDFRVNRTELGSLYEELGYTKLASDIEALGINFDLATLITLLTTLLEVLQYFKGK